MDKNNFQLTWLPKKTFEIVSTVPWEEIKKTRAEVVAQAAKTLEIKGFRKGKAPEKLVRESLGDKKILEQTLGKIIADLYEKAITELGLRPIVSPKLELLESKEESDWKIKFTSSEEPEVKLGDYKNDLKTFLKPTEIWTPGKEGKEEKKKDEEIKDEKLQKIIDWLLENIKVEVSDLIIESEVSRKLSGLLEQTQKLGLTIDQYLSNLGKTVEELREEYRTSCQKSLVLEFVFNKIAEEEKILVEQGEIQKTIDGAKTEKEKKSMEDQKYLIASLLRRQKTLDFLANL